MPSVSIEDDASTALEAAAHRVDDLVAAALRWRGDAVVGLSYRKEAGGFFDHLAQCAAMADPRVGVAQIDGELDVLPGQADWASIGRRLLGPLATLQKQQFPMWLEDQALTTDDALDDYRHRLDVRCGGLFSFDVAQLVLGASGEVGALSPNDPILDSTKNIDRNADRDDGHAINGSARAGLTFAALQRSRTIVVLAVGEDKAEHLHHLVELDGRVPASQLRHPRIEVFADRSAASFLAIV